MEVGLSGLVGPRPVERTETAQQEGSLAVLTELDEREWRALDEIETALAKMEAGTYGACEACGLAIPLVRLYASPATRFCLACQAEYERAHPRGRRPTRVRATFGDFQRLVA
jgi:RNA polymerase-binding transcription factor DksA